LINKNLKKNLFYKLSRFSYYIGAFVFVLQMLLTPYITDLFKGFNSHEHETLNLSILMLFAIIFFFQIISEPIVLINNVLVKQNLL